MTSMFLFGAGASIDAGLDDAFKLTEKIYRCLTKSRDHEAAKIFGLVVAKVIARRVRAGGSPFQPVNVEEVYDGIQRLARKETDLLSDFVTGWDPALASLGERVSEAEIDNAVGTLINSIQADNWRGRGAVKVGSGGSRDLKKVLQKIAEGPSGDSLSRVEKSLLRSLVECLQHDSARIEYFKKLVEIAKSNSADIATLNYDLIAEDSASSLGFSHDYGLDKWNDEKVVEFGRSSAKNIRIIKLHGSLNWYAKGDDINIKEPEGVQWGALPNLVFGGAGSKLRIDGPFLQLRHEFQSRLLKTNILVIIGYSFQDEHLNSVIRRWTSTRRNAKMIVVNPSVVSSFAELIGRPFLSSPGEKDKELTVDLIHLKLGAANAVERLRSALEQPISLERELRSGLSPHIYFRDVA